MTDMPSVETLRSALSKAGAAHHDYEMVYLRGVRDAHWAGWYAAHVLGQLGDFMSPSRLTVLLEQTKADGDWSEAAARLVTENASNLSSP